MRAMSSDELILVTGSTGHLGEALVRTLRSAGRRVRGVDRLASPYTDVVGSIADPGLVAQAMAGVTAVLHTATLHKPHVESHTRQDFIDTNVTGTLNLLEAAAAQRARRFVFTSTTSTFGDAMAPPLDAPAAWITEDVAPVPKNIYGVTKVAAEDLCALAARNQGLRTLVLRTSRFFPEADDSGYARATYGDANLKAIEYLYRRVDIEDVVDAHLRALQSDLPFGRYIISATTPFVREDAAALRSAPETVLDRRVPGWRAWFATLGWQMLPTFDRVYDNAKARRDLGWQPRYDFATVTRRALDGGDIQSALARTIGIKGYHDGELRGGLYPDGAAPR